MPKLSVNPNEMMQHCKMIRTDVKVSNEQTFTLYQGHLKNIKKSDNTRARAVAQWQGI